jgi:hypothetical protein
MQKHDLAWSCGVSILVMPFLFVLTCSMVFFSRERKRPEEPANPPRQKSPH